MTKTAEEKIAIQDAWEAGAEIEFKHRVGGDGEWVPADPPFWRWEYNDYRVKPKPLVDDSVDWSHIKKEWKFMARDAAGRIFVYDRKPYPGEKGTVWGGNVVYRRIDDLLNVKIGNKPWDESLVERK